MEHYKMLEKICRKELRKAYRTSHRFTRKPYARILNLNYLSFFTFGLCPVKKRLKLNISYEEAIERLERELEYIKAFELADRFLVARMIVRVVNRTQSMTTKGTCGGTLVAYLLGMSDVYALSPDISPEEFYEKEDPRIVLDILEENNGAALKTIAAMGKKGYRLSDFQPDEWMKNLNEYGTSRSSDICLYTSRRTTRELMILEELSRMPASNIDPRDEKTFNLMKRGFILLQYEFLSYEIELLNQELNAGRVDHFEDLVYIVGLSMGYHISSEPDGDIIPLYKTGWENEISPFKENSTPVPENCVLYPKAQCIEIALRYCRLMWYKMMVPGYGHAIVNEVWGEGGIRKEKLGIHARHKM